MDPVKPMLAYWLEATLATCLVLFAVALATCATGCSPSALRIHAETAAAVTVTVSAARTVIRESAAADFERCADRDCVATVEQRYGPVTIAHDSLRLALIGWVDALEVARLAGDSADLWAPLTSAASRVLLMWNELVALVGSLGVTLPPLPPGLPALLRGAL